MEHRDKALALGPGPVNVFGSAGESDCPAGSPEVGFRGGIGSTQASSEERWLQRGRVMQNVVPTELTTGFVM